MAAMEGGLGLGYDDEEEEDYVGLACPPFDEAALEMVQNTTMDLSGFFNEFNDDGFLPYRKNERKGKDLERVLKALNKTEAESGRIRAQLARLKQESCDCVIKKTEEESMQVKFQSTKRRLHDSYERIDNEKKKKKIQVIEFRDLAKSKSKQTQRYSSLCQKMKNYRAKLHPKKFRPVVY